MASSLLRLLVILLGFYHLICLNAVPLGRTRTFVHGNEGSGVLADTDELNREEVGEENIINGRMDVEVNDYPGSGANNRHTPRQQLGRGCVDC